jgi:hypothetical protein
MYEQPPVLVRGISTGAPSTAVHRTKNKRRYDVAIGVPGPYLADLLLRQILESIPCTVQPR